VGNEPRWVDSVLVGLRVAFPILLFFLIVWAYSNFPRYGSVWLILAVCGALFFYLGFDKIREFEITKVFKLKTTQPEETLSEKQREKVRNEAEKPFGKEQTDRQRGDVGRPLEDKELMKPFLARHDLSVLLSNYSFFYGRQDAPSDIIRFSDEFSGRPLRYISHFSQDLDRYLSEYSRYLRKPLREAVESLKGYIDYKNRDHKKEEKLSKPVFSAQEYVKLVKDVVESFTAENFQTSA